MSNRVKTFRVPITKQDPDPHETLEDRINEWLASTGAEPISSTLHESNGWLACLLIYRNVAVGSRGAPLDPNAAQPVEHEFTGTVVSREVEKIVGDEVSLDYCMAGAFPVPEEYCLSVEEDSEPAPKVLLSPAFDLTPYKDWFYWPGRPK